MTELPRWLSCFTVLFCLPLLLGGSPGVASGVDFPGPEPGKADARADEGRLLLENEVLACTWTVTDQVSDGARRFRPDRVVDELSKTTLSFAGSEGFHFVVAQSPSHQGRLLSASDFTVVGPPTVTPLEPDGQSPRLADRCAGRQIMLHLASPDGNLEIQWRAVLRDGANYIRQHLLIKAIQRPVELRELVLGELSAPNARVAGSVDGSPVVAGNFFVAYEHPMSRSTVVPAEGPGSRDVVRCGYPYNLVVQPGNPLEHTFTVGVVPAGQLRRGFLFYLERERAYPYRTFLHHSCGYQVGCRFWQLRRYGTPEAWEQFVGRQEALWLELINTFGREMVERRGVVLDSFVHDHGWDDVDVVWEFHHGYPRGFAPEREAAGKYQSTVGVWLSPWGGYSGRKYRIEAGQRQGFEANKNGLSLAGDRYYTRVRQVCLGMIRDFGVNYFKFDGFGSGNNQTGAGTYASDVEALLRLCGELRRARPDVFLNPTTGTWPSPFWLLWADAIWRQESDAGFLGPGSDRQQWITYRDNAVYHSTIQRGPLYPISSLMLHGIMIHGFAFKNPYDPANPPVSRQTADVVAEIRSYFATGTNMQELHIDPSLLTETTWDVLAEAARWSRTNADVLADTHWVGGDPAEGDVYGWASWSKRKGVLALRNPSDQPGRITLDIAVAFELPDAAPREYLLKSPWAEDAEKPAIALRSGRPHRFQLQPLEVLVWDAVPSP